MIRGTENRARGERSWNQGYDDRIAGKPAEHQEDRSYMLGFRAGETADQDQEVAFQAPNPDKLDPGPSGILTM